MAAMAAIDRSRLRDRRPSTLGLLGRQVPYQLKLLARSPMAAFATIVIPLMVLLAINLLYSGTHLSSRGGISYAQFFTPAMVAFAVGAGVYGFQVIWAGVPAALLTLAVAMFCFCSLGIAVTVLVPTADSAVPIAWGTMLPLLHLRRLPADRQRPALAARDRVVLPAAPVRRRPRVGVQPDHRKQGDPPGSSGADGPVGRGGGCVRAARVPLGSPGTGRETTSRSWIATVDGVRSGPRPRIARAAKPTRASRAAGRTLAPHRAV
jgi:hypothetical protein